MKASLSNYRQSPRKVRLVASFVKGKSVEDALAHLDILGKRASLPVKKLIKSAVANSKLAPENLVIKDIRVDKGMVLKRSIPRARGSASRIHKRSSHIRVVLGEITEAPKTKKLNKKSEK